MKGSKLRESIVAAVAAIELLGITKRLREIEQRPVIVGTGKSASTTGGAVDSVNGQTGVVVLDTGDITEAANANYVSDAQLVVLGNTSGTNTGDQDLSSYATKSGTETLTNKRITKRFVTLTIATDTYTPNADTTDVAYIDTPTVAFTVANASGTPTEAQQLMIRILSTTSRAITWGANYRSTTNVTLPTATTANKTDYLGFQWNAVASKWDLLASNNV